MPASPVSLAWQGGLVRVAPDGGVTLSPGGLSGQVELSLAGGADFIEVLTDLDVVEHEGNLGELSIGQRVSVAEHCQLRWVVEVPDEPVEPVRLDLWVRASPQHSMWLWPGGADGLLVVLPTCARGPVLVVQAVQAELRVARDPGDGRTVRLTITPGGLVPGRRHVVQLRAQVVAGVGGLTGLLPVWFAPTRLNAGEPWSAPLADLGVAVGPEVVVTHAVTGSMVDVTAPAGRHHLAVHGPRGVTDVVLHVAPPLAEIVASLAERLLARPGLTPAGALVVHRALQSGLVRRTAQAEDMLDRVDWTSRGDLLAIAFGSERAFAEGERAMAAEAVREVAELPVVPGHARVAALAALAAATLGAADALTGLDNVPVGVEVAGLEQQVVAGRRTAGTAAALAAVIGRLGAGLPGYPLGLDPTSQALLVGLLEAVPEGWPEAAEAASTAQGARQQLLAGYASGELVDPAPIAWLLVSG